MWGDLRLGSRVDRTRGHALARCTVSAPRDGAAVLAANRNGDHQRESSCGERRVTGRRGALVQASWRHATVHVKTYRRPVPVVRGARRNRATQAQNIGVREIARRIGRSPSTVSRELTRNAATRSGQLEYHASAVRGLKDADASSIEFRRFIDKNPSLLIRIDSFDRIQPESEKCYRLLGSRMHMPASDDSYRRSAAHASRIDVPTLIL